MYNCGCAFVREFGFIEAAFAAPFRVNTPTPA